MRRAAATRAARELPLLSDGGGGPVERPCLANTSELESFEGPGGSMWTVHHVYCVWRNPESRLRDGRVISIACLTGADTDNLSYHCRGNRRTMCGGL